MRQLQPHPLLRAGACDGGNPDDVSQPASDRLASFRIGPIVAYIDGGAPRNPGPAGYGCGSRSRTAR